MLKLTSLYYNQKMKKSINKFLAILAIALCAGCASNTRYVEGTHLALGAYIPYESKLYGVELIQYLNGISITCQTNNTLKVEHYATTTNSWLWGMLESTTTAYTKSEVK